MNLNITYIITFEMRQENHVSNILLLRVRLKIEHSETYNDGFF